MDQKKLEHWATELLAGCDGGNLSTAKVWICGIEWGWPLTRKQDKEAQRLSRIPDYQVKLPLEVEHGLVPAWALFYDYLATYPFNKQFTKLYTALKGLRPEDYLKHVDAFSKNDVFKMNLFPIAFEKDDEWFWQFYQLPKVFPDFKTKVHYQNWCREHRFSYFRKLVQMYQPEVILCTGSKYELDFLRAFGGTERTTFDESGVLVDNITGRNSKPRLFHYARLSQKTQLFVFPFLLNRNGLNSHELLRQLGSEIKKKAA